MAQYIRLTGVRDDGVDRRPRVPFNTAKTIQVPLHSDITIEVAVVNPAGVAEDLAGLTAGTWSATFAVVRSPDSCVQAAGKVDYQLTSTTILSGSRNVIVFTVTKTALRRLAAGRYFYDVSLTIGSDKYQVVRISGLHLEAALKRA